MSEEDDADDDARELTFFQMKNRVTSMRYSCESWSASVPICTSTNIIHDDIFEIATSLAMLRSLFDIFDAADDIPEKAELDDARDTYVGLVRGFNELSDAVHQFKLGISHEALSE